MGLRTTAGVWNVATKYEPFAKLFFFFFMKKEPTSRGKVVGLSVILRTACLCPRKKVSTMENFVLCSSAHHACSPLLQESLHEVGAVQRGFEMSFLVGRVVPLSEVSGAFLEFFWRVVSFDS